MGMSFNTFSDTAQSSLFRGWVNRGWPPVPSSQTSTLPFLKKKKIFITNFFAATGAWKPRKKICLPEIMAHSQTRLTYSVCLLTQHTVVPTWSDNFPVSNQFQTVQQNYKLRNRIKPWGEKKICEHSSKLLPTMIYSFFFFFKKKSLQGFLRGFFFLFTRTSTAK